MRLLAQLLIIKQNWLTTIIEEKDTIFLGKFSGYLYKYSPCFISPACTNILFLCDILPYGVPEVPFHHVKTQSGDVTQDEEQDDCEQSQRVPCIT